MPKNTFIITTIVLLLAALALPANAGAWSSAQTSGITLLHSMLDMSTNTFTWTLTNGSARPGIPDALIWSLQPFNVPAPITWTAPDGWVWTTNGWATFGIDDNSEKYYTPPAIAPGQSAVFTYTVDPESPRINPYGSGYDGDPDAIGFITHIGQVVPDSGTLDGSTRWIAATNPLYGATWYDRCTVESEPPEPPEPPYPPVPEPSSLAVLAFGLTSLASLAARRRRA